MSKKEEQSEVRNKWVQQTVENAEVVAAHEQTAYLHKVALQAARLVFSKIDGSEERGESSPIEWGKLHSLGPVREWVSMRWKSKPVLVGEARENDLGLEKEFAVLSLYGKVESRRERSLRHPLGVVSQAIIGERYEISRELGNSPVGAQQTILHPDRKPVYFDTNYTCRDMRGHEQWSSESQVADYDNRFNGIVAFLDELSVLAFSARLQPFDLLHFSAEHVSSQLRSVADVDQTRLTLSATVPTR